MIKPEAISKLFPIGAIAWYSESKVATVLRYSGATEVKSPRKPTKRGLVATLSTKSMNRLNFLIQTTTVNFQSMLTLTYLCPPPTGKRAKFHLKGTLEFLKRRCGGKLEYVWFCEFTQVGNVHFHVLLDCQPTEMDRVDLAYYWLKKTNQGQGRYCSLRQRKLQFVLQNIFSVQANEHSWQNIRSENGAKGYVAKYAGKPKQKQVPHWFKDMGRFWGVSKGVVANREKPITIEINEAELREILREQEKTIADWEVLPRYIWGLESPNV